MSWFLKYRKPLLLLTGLVICFCIFSMDSAFAAGSTNMSVESYANSSGGSRETYNLLTNPNTGVAGFDNIIREIGTGIIRSARYIVAILIAASGIMVAFGVEDGKKTMWSVILGIGLALNLGSFLYAAYGTYLGAPPATEQGQSVEFQPLIPNDVKLTETKDAAQQAYNQAAKENYEDMLSPKQNPSTEGKGYHFFTTFINSYVKYVIQPGAENLKGILIKLALLITLIDASLKIALELTGSGVMKLMISLALKLGFNIFLIENWLTNIKLTQSLCNGFEELGFIAGGESLKGNDLVLSGLADGSIKAGFSIFSAFTGFICDGLSLFSQPFLILFGLVLMVFFLIGMVWLALEMFMAQIEFYTMALLTMMLLPFMMSQHTSFLSNNAIAAMFNCAMKVCVIAFLSVVGMSTLGRYFNSLMKESLSPSNFAALLLQFDVTVLVLLFLVWQMPKLVQGLLSGSPQFGAGQMVGMISSGVSTVAGVAGGVAGGMALGAAGGVTGGAAGGGGGAAASRMSSTANPASSAMDAKGTSPGMETEAGKPDMSKYNGSAPSTPTDSAGTEKGDSSPAPASKTPSAADQASSAGGGSGGGYLDKASNIGKALGNAVTHAAFNSAPVKSFQQGYNAVTDPYGVGPAGQAQGATGRSWKSGHMVDAQGNVINDNGGGGSRGNSSSGVGSDGKSPETDGAEDRQHEKKVTDNIVTVHSANITDTGGATMDLNIKGQDIRVTVNPVPPPITPFNPNGK